MGYWERVSYLSAHNSWVIAILYMTVIGAVFLYFARCLNHHQGQKNKMKIGHGINQDQQKNIKIIVKIMIVVVLFFVIMGSIVLSLFGDASRSSETLGTWAAMIIFILCTYYYDYTISTRSVVDVCAGFLFVSLFVNNEGATIEAAILFH